MNGSKYYRLLSDPQSVCTDGYWYLASPLIGSTKEEVDPRLFTVGKPVGVMDLLTMPLRRSGESIDITFADFDMPVITTTICKIFEELAPEDIQVIPITVEGSSQTYWILNVLALVDCLDAESSIVQWWTVADGRADKVGQPKMIVDLKIDKKKIGDHEIFRIANWKIALVVSEKIKAAVENAGVYGIRFEAV